jgi:hypothetical protein
MARVSGGRSSQGIYLDCSSRQEAREFSVPELDSYICTQRTTPEDLASALTLLAKPHEAHIEATDPQRMEFPDDPRYFVLKNADLLPNKSCHFLLQIMKKCSREDIPLLVVVTGTGTKLLSRLYSVDPDSSMMWHSVKPESQ